MRQKIDYGIDLGTTNSAIARMDSGEAKIIKSDDNQMDTTPSCVSFNKKKTIFVGESAKNQVNSESTSAFRSRREAPSNSYLEFKRTMGTDHAYLSTWMERSFTSEELSAEVLKKLRGYIHGEDVTSVVITVPAMFEQSQIDATQRAAEIAGFKYCELLQEPIAASIAYGVKANVKSGYWLVFDFGGGTFDVALMHVDEGVMKVVDTEGDNHLGGKNLDTAIVDQLFIPELRKACAIDELLVNQASKTLLQGALKTYAEQAKIALSSKSTWEYYLEDLGADDEGEEIEADLHVSLAQYDDVCGPLFQKAIDICQELLKRNKLSGADLSTMVLVGGPTFSQTLRRMLKEQITDRIDTSIDPMTAVACGAALFASTKSVPSDLLKRDLSKAQLTLKYPETTVETHENLGVLIDRKKSTSNLPSSFVLEIIRSDRGWSSGKLTMDSDAEVVEVVLNEGKANQFEIKLISSDGSVIPCEPSTITIIHGLKIANSTLTHSIGLEVYDTTDGRQGVYAFKGLEKNKSLPAKGKGFYKTAKDIRPNNGSDKFTIQFYGFNYGTEGSRAILNSPFGGVTVTGEQLPSMLPAQSEIELTLSIDASRRASLSIFIPALDETIHVQFESSTIKSEDVDVLRNDIQEARKIAEKLSNSEHPADVSSVFADIYECERLLDNRWSEIDTRVRVRGVLQKVFISLDKIEAANQWPEIESKLNSALVFLQINEARYGNDKSRQMVGDYQKRVFHAKAGRDYNSAKQLYDEILAFSFALVQQDIGFWMSLIKEYDNDFETTDWTDRREARRVLNDAKLMIAMNPSKSKIEIAVRTLWSLMPKDKRDAAQKTSGDILWR